VLLLEGLPGESDDADLAEAMRRDGWSVLTITYRGTYGDAGNFSLTHALEDGAAAAQWLRSPEGGGAAGVDPARIVLVGYGLGGWIAALTTARDPALLGAALISASDVGGVWGKTPRAGLAAALDARMGGPDNRRPLQGAGPEFLADEAARNTLLWSFAEAAPGLRGRNLLVITPAGEGSADATTLADTLINEGETHVRLRRLGMDPSYSGARIALEADLLRWLENLPGAPDGL
jgi:pimeloyl-ACP methyl ester carboxylesterase